MCEQIVRPIVSSQNSNWFHAFQRAQHVAQLQQLFVSERFDQSQVRRELPENAYIGLCIHVFEERFEFVAIQSANIHNEQKQPRRVYIFFPIEIELDVQIGPTRGWFDFDQ